MSTNSIDYGSQTLSFDFREEARAVKFNKLFYNLLPYGIYHGLALARRSDTSVAVTHGTVIIPSNNGDDTATKIDTAEDQLINFADSVGGGCNINKPFVILRFGWSDVEDNFMEIIKAAFDDILETDIIVGKVNFEQKNGKWVVGTNGSFDLSKRQVVIFKNLEQIKNLFQVKPTEPASNKVSVSGGVLVTSKGKIVVPSTTIPDDGIEATTSLGRIDIVALDTEGKFHYLKGTPAVAPKAPAYLNYKVLAEIKLGTNQSIVNGLNIQQVSNWDNLQGTIAPEDTPLVDTPNHFPGENKTVAAALEYLWKHSLVLNHGGAEVVDFQVDTETDVNYPLGSLFL